MLHLLSKLWAHNPEVQPPSTKRSEAPEFDAAPPIPYTEEDNDPTEEAPVSCTPTQRLSPDAAYELAEAAIEDKDFESAKCYLQFYNWVTRG